MEFVVLQSMFADLGLYLVQILPGADIIFKEIEGLHITN